LKYTEANLTSAEVKSAEKNDLSFLDAEKQELTKWDNELRRRFNILMQNPRGPRIEYYHMPARELCSILDMPERPIAPESVFLCCWHEQWNSKNDPGLLKTRHIHKCQFYYPLAGKGGKSFDGCYRDQQDSKLNKNMLIATWTLGATIVGILVAILLRVV
jgi:hypothetical protein